MIPNTSVSTRTPLEFLNASKEAELIGEAQSGDRVAYLNLVRHYQRPLYRLAYAMSRSEEGAAALAQEAFARVWKDIAEYPSGRRFFHWLLHVVRNLPGGIISTSAAPDGDDPLLKAIEALRPDDRMALALRIVERVRYQEIAALLNLPTGIVILRIAQARGLMLAGTGNLDGGEP